jgi:hypothetical protein
VYFVQVVYDSYRDLKKVVVITRFRAPLQW